MRLWFILSLIAGLALLAAPPGSSSFAASPPAPATIPATFKDCPECPDMVRVPGGTFQMGSVSATAMADQKPVHAVTVRPFAAGAYEVTREQYAAFVAATGYASTGYTAPDGCLTNRDLGPRWSYDPETSWRDSGLPQTDRDPVVCVAWYDAVAYTNWLSKRTGKAYRLLSEAEWEYAGRAGTTTDYWWGDNADDLCPYANGPDLEVKAKFPNWRGTVACHDGHPFSAPVGSYKPNAFGLYDMAGNVWEWTADCYEPGYGVQPTDGSAYTGGDCQKRALRGGSWAYAMTDLLAAQRNGLPRPTTRGADIGFRVARAL